MKHLLFLLVFVVFTVGFSAGQFRGPEGELLVLSRHVWRGSQLGNDIAIEPSLTVANGPFRFNVWAALTPNNSYSEVDLIPSVVMKHFCVTLFNYYNPVPGEANRYFSLKKGESRHSLELSFDNFPIEEHRFKWMVGTFLFGDRNKSTGRPMFSTYIEARYPFLLKGVGVEPFAGLTTHRGYYADRFALINTGVNLGKEINLKSPFTIPLELSFIVNPYARQHFVVLSAGVAF